MQVWRLQRTNRMLAYQTIPVDLDIYSKENRRRMYIRRELGKTRRSLYQEYEGRP